MKLPISIFAGLLLGSALLHAAPQLYDITLLDNQKFTQCRISFETDSKIKFQGIDQNGKSVTKTIDKKDLFIKREATKVEAPKKDTPAEPKAAEETKQEETSSEEAPEASVREVYIIEDTLKKMEPDDLLESSDLASSEAAW